MLRLCLTTMILVVFNCQAHAGQATDPEDNQPATRMLQNGGAVNGQFVLDIAGQPIAAAYLPQTLGERRGAVILLHDKAAQFDSPLLHQLREDLAAFGWDSLTVSLHHQAPKAADKSATAATAETATDTPQNQTTAENVSTEPPADKTAETDDASDSSDNSAEQIVKPATEKAPPGNPARLDAAIAWLQAKNPPHLIFIGHGAGVATALAAIAATPRPVSALVMISADDDINAEKIIDANLPVLDIAGSQIDSKAKQAAVMRRSQLKNTSTQPFSQRQINGADRDFQGLEVLLAKQIHSWLHRQLIADLRR